MTAMNRIIIASVLLPLLLGVGNAEPYPIQNKSFGAAASEGGCGSPYSAMKQAMIWSSDYLAHRVVWRGIVSEADSSFVKVKVNAFSYDFAVSLADGQSGDNLMVGQPITISFVLMVQGGCFLPFEGMDGVIVNRLS